MDRLFIILCLVSCYVLSTAQEVAPQNFGVSIGPSIIQRDTIQAELSYAQMENLDEFQVMLDGINLNMRIGRSNIHEFQLSLTVPRLAADTFLKNLVLGRFGVKNTFYETERCKMGVMGTYYFIVRKPFNLEDLLMGIRLQAPMQFVLNKHLRVNTELSSTYKLFGPIFGGLQNRYTGGLLFLLGEKAQVEFGAIMLHQQLRPHYNEKEALWLNRRYVSAAAMFQLGRSIAFSVNYRQPFYQSEDILMPAFGSFFSTGIAVNLAIKANTRVEARIKEQDVY